MADEDLSLNEDQLLDNLDDANGDGDLLITEEQDESGMQIDPELEAIKARVKEMEEEAEKLKQLQSEVNKQLQSPPGVPALSAEEKKEIDDRSVYVGNVDYGATAEELEAHFHGCGSINRVTILCNKVDGHPKGFAYIEFGSKEFVDTALAMNETLFRGRQIKVMAKRTNRPGLCATNRFPRGFRGRIARGGRGLYCPFTHRGRGRVARVYRGRANYYSPY